MDGHLQNDLAVLNEGGKNILSAGVHSLKYKRGWREFVGWNLCCFPYIVAAPMERLDPKAYDKLVTTSLLNRHLEVGVSYCHPNFCHLYSGMLKLYYFLILGYRNSVAIMWPWKTTLWGRVCKRYQSGYSFLLLFFSFFRNVLLCFLFFVLSFSSFSCFPPFRFLPSGIWIL